MTESSISEGATEGLTILGNSASANAGTLETFPNRHPGRRYTVTLETSEFTCVCPMTGQPDFATLRIRYIPDARIVESKSLKLYLWQYRNQGVFHEHVTNKILDDLVAALQPLECEVRGILACVVALDSRLRRATSGRGEGRPVKRKPLSLKERGLG